MAEAGGALRVGVDIGGTFTDFVVLDEASGRLRTLKVPSTPREPSQAILHGLEQLAALGLTPRAVRFFAHGTTIATNALLEGKGARCGLLITRGFRAVQEVQDQTRGAGAAIYDFFWERAPLLVPQERTGEVPERLDAHGRVVLPLDADAARREVRRLCGLGVESFAVCLLFSFLNPAHERALRDIILEEAPGARVSLSSDVLPVIREWFRLSTTQVNAYVASALYRYLHQMTERLDSQGVGGGQRYVMQSNGGTTSFARAADHAVTTILSGPAAGVIAGARLAQVAGYPNVITFDIGGTSTDIALVAGGIPAETTTGKVGGYAISVPMLDIHTISAGGGTIAGVDAVGTLYCGPHSAGADPGPACYGKGGARATITDANVVLGYLSPDHFLGGRVPLDAARAAAAVAANVGAPLGLTLDQAAAGAVRLIDVQMADGVRFVSTERGYDLRDFALVAFGGAGPVHAAAIARELGIGRVVVPRYPGLTSALGLLMSDVKHDYLRSAPQPLAEVQPERAAAILSELDALARADLAAEGLDPATATLVHQLDLRYAGQGYELSVPLDDGPLTTDLLLAARARFDALHEQLHGHGAAGEPVEVVSYRTVCVAAVPKVALEAAPASAAPADGARKGARRAWFPGTGWFDCPLYDRERLVPGMMLDGPAIVEHVDSTTVVHPGQSLVVDAWDNLVLHIPAAAAASPAREEVIAR